MEIVISIVAKVAELLVVPIKRQIGYVIDCNTNIQNLKNEVEKLTYAKTRVIHSIEEAISKGEEIEVDVENWLGSVDGVIEGGCGVVGDESSKKCFMGLCPDLKIRYRLGKAAKEELTVVVDLQEKGKFDRVSYRAAPSGIGPFKDYEAFESRNSVLNDIVDALKDGDVNMVGVYGMGGVGKTTLVNKVAEQVKEGRLFDKVVLALVSPTPDIRRIQGEIADGLGLKLDAETDKGRASQLCRGLKKVTTVLVILDDIWKELKLEDVGIPSGSDHEGCKILMTSRNKNILSREMGANRNFQIQILPVREAWNFFEKMVGVTVKNPSVQLVAAEVAKRCAGLPILLATVARALKNEDLYAWKEALTQLTRFDKDDIDKTAYSCLELSYKALRDDEIKSLFLLCGQILTYDALISDLLKYAIGLDLFKGRSTSEEARNRLHTLVDELKASCLLLEGDNDGSVKMHDVVQSFAISVALRDHHVLTVADEFKEWPTNDVLQQYTAISLPFRKIPDLPAILECPNLNSFLLLSTDPSLQIPEKIFREMKELKVLDLTGVNLSPLPSSLQFLENLQTLCLDFCVLEDISIVGELKKLKVLSLMGSDIVCLPREIGKLTRLLLLDLSNCERLEVISPNVLSSLTRLEELYMGNSFLKWEAEGPSSERNSACLSELKLLANLITLDMQITDADHMPKDLFLCFQKLERFRIFIGDGWDWSVKYATSRTLKLKLNTVIQLEERVNTLLKITEELHLQELNGVKSILNDLDEEGFCQLKDLHVQNCPGVQYIINSMRMGPRTAFLNLDSLFLENLDNLEKICHGQLMAELLGNLRILKVESCHRLKNLFSVSIARRVVRLEEITIIDCKIMEEVVAEESENDTADGEPIEFTQLRRLTLQCLPQFTSFHSNRRQKLLASDVRSKEIVAGNELGTSMSLFNTKILFPNLEDLMLSSIKVEKIWHDQHAVQPPCVKNLASIAVQSCSNLNYLLTSSMVESLAQLKSLEICNCKSMEEIVVPEGIGEGKMMSKMLFPKLLILSLISLPKLTRFCTSNLLECHSLKVLTLGKCPELKEFIAIPSSADVPAMSKPDNSKSALFDDKVAFPNLVVFVSFEMDNLKVIWHNELHPDSFCRLKILHVGHGKNLLNIFPSSMLGRFHNLENLVINDCDSVEEIFDLQALINVEQRLAVTASQLRVVRLTNLPHLKHVWNRDPQGIVSFHNLCTVHVQGCLGLRSLFPASIAQNLLQLELLRIDTCGVEEIVAKDEGLEEGPEFVFPKVTFLQLRELPELKRFYPGIHTSEWPRLKTLRVYDCEKIEIFPSEIKCSHEPCREDHMDIQGQQPLLSFRKIFPNLEDLHLESKDASALLKCPQYFFHKLKVLELFCFGDAHATFLFDLLPRFPNMERLNVERGTFKELLPSRLVGMEEHATALSPIRHLELDSLPCLEHLWKSNSQLDQALQTLETLRVHNCGSLIYLAPSRASFQNLTNLDVWNCERLVKLVTSTTAKSLAQLTRMSIKDCSIVTVIVANEGDGIKDEIVFRKLEILELHRLPSLTSFCSEKHSFDFPSLVEVTVSQCPEMKFFSNGALSTPKLRRVNLTEEEKKGSWVGNLNTTIQQLSTQTKAQIAGSIIVKA
ncbi:probable disease resistance protein At4g27220 isoform X1 [Populus nigra]|uniref:probable disease resistance protein At4g27220 isoform X1 n=1 Tax=Populus nigra TaxID=3691 RepID=UPI002B278AB4|nr:probable disease resistance protein At4g27220 isoform X1 [Populus nigra]XP_061971523.1 probable disease resistance protein At4g27220 isoform X1 [Populus nigra]XP_061971524.1 probable disease resistance protein At4g27220 isoform X1 [Populus nigra]XP_061971525.1 probable disease resistance protein At4g27220 isoform X1 [Populus nigra]XP_061971526.1 probable disease resistance protein At4g27220 isoform X1 [Populus nigra]